MCTFSHQKVYIVRSPICHVLLKMYKTRIDGRSYLTDNLYTHSINGGALGNPGPNSARTRLVSPLGRRTIKYGRIYTPF